MTKFDEVSATLGVGGGETVGIPINQVGSSWEPTILFDESLNEGPRVSSISYSTLVITVNGFAINF